MLGYFEVCAYLNALYLGVSLPHFKQGQTGRLMRGAGISLVNKVLKRILIKRDRCLYILTYVVQPNFFGFYFDWIFLTNVAHVCIFWLSVQSVIINIHFGINRHDFVIRGF